jgi:EamA domain-containing membrane protein RarD
MVKTVKVKNKSNTTKKVYYRELDSIFILKMALYLILGSQWLYIISPDSSDQLSIPIGAIIAVLFAMHEHFKIDRKIEYAIILLAMFIGFWLPMGITLVR